jgi:hypothetical protein
MEAHRSEQGLAGRADPDVAAPQGGSVREQRLRSLGQANEIRTARAALKTELASGRAQIEDVLARPPACAMTAKVSELLLALPGLGPARATHALARCQIPYGKTAAGPGERQRVVLIALLQAE